MRVPARLGSIKDHLTHSNLPWRIALPTSILLAALAFAVNSVGVPLFINARLVFGSVFVVFAVSALGPAWALLVGAAAAVASGIYWGYPVLALPFALEALWMALFFRSDRDAAVVAIGAYWVSLGAPLALLLSIFSLDVDSAAAGLFVVTRILNGLLAALLAELLIRVLPRIGWVRRTFRMENKHRLESLLVSIMIGLILVPALIIVTSGARAMQDAAERVVRGEIRLTASSFARSMSGWLDENYQNIRSLAHVASVHHRQVGGFGNIGPQVEVLKHADTDFLALALFDPNGNPLHVRPAIEPPAEGRQALMSAKEAIMEGAAVGLSGIFPMQAVGRTTRAVVLAVPVKSQDGSLVAIAAGIVDAASLHSHLESTRGRRNVSVSVHDGHGQLFSSSDAAGTSRLVATDDRVQHYGPSLKRVGFPIRSKVYAVDLDKGYYEMRVPIEPYSGWQVQVVRYLDETLAQLVQRDIAALLLTFAVVFVVGLIAVFFSRGIVSSITALKTASADASLKITEGTAIDWPQSYIKEVASLSGDFQEMSRELRTSFSELHEAKQRAEEASLAKSRFLQNVSHELRTPLNGILGFAQLLDRDDNVSEEHHEAVQGILQSGNDLLRFIKDLLIHAKIDSQHIRLTPEPVRLREAVDHVADTVRPSAAAKRLAFHVQVDDELPEIIRVDDKRLQQILYNLLSNAVAYTDAGSISLRVDREGPEHARFAVSDTGPGIPAEDIDSLFSPLRQLERHPQARGGTGLGLSIVKRLVEMMGGRVYVESTEGLGSTFRVSIPIRASES